MTWKSWWLLSAFGILTMLPGQAANIPLTMNVSSTTLIGLNQSSISMTPTATVSATAATNYLVTDSTTKFGWVVIGPSSANITAFIDAGSVNALSAQNATLTLSGSAGSGPGSGTFNSFVLGSSPGSTFISGCTSNDYNNTATFTLKATGATSTLNQAVTVTFTIQ